LYQEKKKGWIKQTFVPGKEKRLDQTNLCTRKRKKVGSNKPLYQEKKKGWIK